ncbi:MAG: hypothetical protein ABJB49_10845 [Nitrospirota bacterium]
MIETSCLLCMTRLQQLLVLDEKPSGCISLPTFFSGLHRLPFFSSVSVLFFFVTIIVLLSLLP